MVARKPPLSPFRALYGGCVLLILIIAASNTAIILHLRESELHYEEGHLNALSLIMAEQADRAFLSVDLVISSVIRGMALEGVTDVASFDTKMASYTTYLSLREKLSGVPQLDAITVLNRQGRMVNFLRSWPIPDLDASDRIYFKILRDSPGRDGT